MSVQLLGVVEHQLKDQPNDAPKKSESWILHTRKRATGIALARIRRCHLPVTSVVSNPTFQLSKRYVMTSFGRSLFFAAAAVCSASLLSSVHAQSSLSTGDGLLKVTSQMPEEVRLGESFNYTVEVSNVSDQVTLHRVKLAQKKAKGLTIESVSQQGEKANEKQSQSEAEEKNRGSKNQMMIQTLKPGESRTFDVQAVADQEGEIRSCLEVVSYKPAICLTSEAVKPQLELTKVAPKKANRCNVIKMEYTLKNGGSGDVGPITIEDSLGDGLATIEGNNELKFDIDGLEAGETRKFIARVYAAKSGEFGSRAEAKATDSDLSSRSKKTQTKVVSADLIAMVEGPNRLYGNDLAHFTATITNQGNAPAEDVRVNLMWPEAANLADVSEPQMKSNQSSKQGDSKKQSEGQPTPAKSEQDSASNQSDSGNGNEQSKQTDSPKMAEKMLTIDTLKPGQSATIDYAIRTGELDEIPTKVKATSVCTVDVAEDEADATTRATATAMTRAKVVRLPALQLTVVDDEDPVNNGSEVTYTIKVWNEGDAIDNNVRLTAELPDGLKFVSADGPTELKEEAQSIQFAPIKKMQPGDEVTYTVKAEGDGEGSVRLTTQLASQSLSSKITAEEPTRIFKR
ncbi:60 kDa outer membrane protein [Rhodopirellula baltica WH47]|uniref:60 kDa outer membrane protein n=1 Tax=Rhodopirellula baltica WH47 TaxID=991778 RepID=F2AP12_RHOBT|nr:60 kDa outer membrane protein [Rhodopirellula baltica WH47]